MAAFHADLPTVVARYVAGATATELAAEYGISHCTVRKHLVRSGVQIRGKGRRIGTFLKIGIAEQPVVVARYQAGATASQLGREYGVDKQTICKVLRAAGVPVLRGRRTAVGDRRPNHYGYMLVRVDPDDPVAWPLYKDNWTLEHRYAMACNLGRRLKREETVHHKNGDRSDNRLENLELRPGKHGNSQRYRCTACGCHNIEAVGLDD